MMRQRWYSMYSAVAVSDWGVVGDEGDLTCEIESHKGICYNGGRGAMA